MSFDLSTNLADLPYGLFNQLALSLEGNALWQQVFSDANDGTYRLSADEMERYRRIPDPGVHLLRHLGNRGQTVKHLITKLHSLAKIYGTVMDKPQLILHRKFCAVIWARPEQIIVACVGDGKQLKLECKASGFPTPRYQWMEEERPIDGANASVLTILRCPCTARNVFKCKVWNVVDEGQEWSGFYRANGKTYQSELVSNVVDLSSFVSEADAACEACNKNKMEQLYRLVNGGEKAENEDDDAAGNSMCTMTENIVAADKVALIISNRTYAPHMSNLITPHCDAETLAENLQQMKFKTVTVGDLTLEEMKFVIREYRKLLGEGVYAVFYFVGHGFEANGQCYLLPIGAPGEGYGPEHCLSMDWVLSMFKDYSPALNLILLDICRRYLPSNLDTFTAYAEQYRKEVKICRNTVYGYATSGGVGAYEVKGEINGVFMKYLKNRIQNHLPVIDMLNKVFRDIEKDKKVRDVQIPELRSNLTKPRSLLDPLIFDGHTTSYDHHTMHWRLMHELPNPLHLPFEEKKLRVTVWFDFCGHFTNKVYVFSSVGDIPTDEDHDESKPPSEHALAHLAYLTFPEDLEASKARIFEDDEEGISLCVMLSNLQRSGGELKCTIELKHHDDPDETVAMKEASLGHVLITRLSCH